MTGSAGNFTRLLYHTLVRRFRRRMLRPLLAALLVTLVGTTTFAAARARTGGAASDRLERFRELASSRLALGDLGANNPSEIYRDIYALLDDEIVDSLASGGVFASSEFLQDRLDAFGEAWGGAHFRLTRLGRLVVGAFRLTETGVGNSVRVYGPLHDEAALLATLYRDGRPSITPVMAPGEPAQFLAAWDGTASARATRPLRPDLGPPHAAGVGGAWDTAREFPGVPAARACRVRGGELGVRYGLR